jgi:hypothetical protein
MLKRINKLMMDLVEFKYLVLEEMKESQLCKSGIPGFRTLAAQAAALIGTAHTGCSQLSGYGLWKHVALTCACSFVSPLLTKTTQLACPVSAHQPHT